MAVVTQDRHFSLVLNLKHLLNKLVNYSVSMHIKYVYSKILTPFSFSIHGKDGEIRPLFLVFVNSFKFNTTTMFASTLLKASPFELN